jgi:hypothetical protein
MLPTATEPPIGGSGTSVGRRFSCSSRTSGCLPVPRHVGYRNLKHNDMVLDFEKKRAQCSNQAMRSQSGSASSTKIDRLFQPNPHAPVARGKSCAF